MKKYVNLVAWEIAIVVIIVQSVLLFNMQGQYEKELKVNIVLRYALTSCAKQLESGNEIPVSY